MSVLQLPGFLFLLCLLAACQPLSNRINDKILLCGAETASFADERLLLPDSPDWQGVVQTGQGFRKLEKSSRGCAVLPEHSQGKLYLRDTVRAQGIALMPLELQGQRALQKELTSEVLGLQARTLTLSCASKDSQGLVAPVLRNSQPSPLLHLYEIRYQLLKDSQKMLEGRVEVDSSPQWQIPLPQVLAEGDYVLQMQLTEVFDQQYQDISNEAMHCPLHIDRSPPVVKGFVENLDNVGTNKAPQLEVSPGQALNLDIQDSSAASVFYCLESETETCSNFATMNGSIYAPNQGVFRLRYYTLDAAGNQSPVKTLPYLAVIHRQVMQNIDNTLSLARLEASRGQSLNADRYLLDAYQAFYQLALPVERDPLRLQLGTSYSEIGRAQFGRWEWKDHIQPIRRFKSLSSLKQLVSLDSSGHLVQRSEDGSLIRQLDNVGDFADLGAGRIFILFRDGRYLDSSAKAETMGELGLNQAQALRFAEDGQSLLVSHAQGLALLQSTNQGFVQRWNAPGIAPTDAFDFGPDHSIGVAADQTLLSLHQETGVVLNQFHWNPLCKLTRWQKTAHAGFFIALKTSVTPETDPGVEFHCEMLQWNGLTEPKIVDAKAIMTKNPIFDPSLFRFEEVETMTYDAKRQWLFLGRNLDGRFLIYDLVENHAEIYDYKFDGQPTAIGLSDDSQSLAISWSVEMELLVWHLNDQTTAADFPLMDHVQRYHKVPRKITNLDFSADQKTVITLDEARQLRGLSIVDTLIPIMANTAPQAYRADSGAGVMRVADGRVELVDNFGSILLSWEAPGNDKLVAVTRQHDAIWALNAKGQLWSHAAASPAGDWILLVQTGATAKSVFPSPSGSKALILEKNAAGKSQVSVIIRQGDGWVIQARVQSEAFTAAWNADETHFALGASKEQSLFTVKGDLVIRYPATRTAVSFSYPYLPFSPNGRLWLVRQDQKLSIFDIELKQPTSAEIKLSTIPGMHRFQKDSNNRLLVAVGNSGGTGQFLYEMDLSGQVIREYGEFPGALRSVIQREQEFLIVDTGGRVYRWTQGVAQLQSLIGETQEIGGLMLEFQSQADTLIVEPRAQAFSFLYLRDDPRQLQRLCTWLMPTLTALGDVRSQKQRAFCQETLGLHP